MVYTYTADNGELIPIVIKIFDESGPTPTLKVFRNIANYDKVRSHWKTKVEVEEMSPEWVQFDTEAREEFKQFRRDLH